MTKTRSKIKNNIERMTRFPQGYLPNWVSDNMDSLIDRAVEILQKNNAIATDENIYKASYMTIDECH